MSTIVVDPNLEEAQHDFLKKVCLFFFGQDHFSNPFSDSHAEPSITSKCFSYEKTRRVQKYVCMSPP